MNAAAFVIRSVVQTDSERLAVLVRELGEYSSITREAPEVTLARVCDHLSRLLESESHTFLVAESGETLVGYASVHWLPMMARLEGYVSELFVGASQRGQGVGTRLLQTIEDEARSRGCTRLHLETYRTQPSYERGFYASLGWQERPAAASFVLDVLPS